MPPYSNSSPQTAKWNRSCGQSIILHHLPSFIFTFFCQCEEPPTLAGDAAFLKLSYIGLLQTAVLQE